MPIFRKRLPTVVNRVWTCHIETCRREHTDDVETCTCGHPRCQECVYDSEARLYSRVRDDYHSAFGTN
ncbi:hypothetical protein AOQ84DRAFT_381923 [Glonium stellatum]|uniref:Uncharacterized protein n=1 Tax=Glonium stellatum TaxID=574774 RepID=A0A8E2JMS8_9PEZI|nr:hypothetical protein AOQ84DRAFT_381923 [Glonium stellatum]